MNVPPWLARELAAQAKRVKYSIPVSGGPGRPGSRDIAGFPGKPGGIPAVVTVGITACSGTTVGTGEAQIYTCDDPESSEVTADAEDSGTVTVLNWYTNSGTIAAGTHVFLSYWSYNYWFVGADC